MLRRLSGRNLPIVTWCLIVFNVAIMMAMQKSNFEEVFLKWALIPESPSMRRFFTSTFLHESYPHLFGNMALLYVVGRRVETVFENVEFLLLYICSGYASCILQLAIVFGFMPFEARSYPVVGSSGAIAGIMGMYCVRFYRETIGPGKLKIPISFFLLIWVIVQAVLGTAGLLEAWGYFNSGWNLQGVGHWSHLGGFIFGMGLALLVRQDVESDKDHVKALARSAETPAEVLIEYETLIRLDPDDPFGHAELGRTWASIEDYDQAGRCYTRAARLYMDQNHTDRALERLMEFRTYLPDAILEPATQLHLADKLESEGRYEDAVRELTILAYGPEQSQYAATALLRVGQINLQRLNRFENAVVAFERFLISWPDSDGQIWAEKWLAEARQLLGRSGA